LVAEKIHKEKPNWLLYSLIIISVLIHAGIFLQASGNFNFKKLSYIEIGIRKNVKPQARQAPRPRQIPRQVRRQTPAPVLPDNVIPDIESIPEPMEPVASEMAVPDSAVSQEDIPEVHPSDVVDFSVPEVAETGGFGSRMDYLDMVRLKIENHKQYPPFSRQRNIEGVVTVAFTIGPNGFISGLSVVKSSGFASLDDAALLAVNRAAPFLPPPDKYFEQKVRVKVPIAFELIK